MKYLHFLTLILITLKLCGFITVSWLVAVAPTIVAIVLWILCFVGVVLLTSSQYKGKLK